MSHANLLSAFVMPEHSAREIVAIALRWIHFVAGIAWVGLLYFFNVVNAPFMKRVETAQRPMILEHLTLPALNLFRWSSLVTVFVGFWYWGQELVGPAAQRAGRSGGPTILLFILTWTIAAAILTGVINKTPDGYVLAIVVSVVVIAGAWTFLHFATVGRDDNHVLSIGIGGGLGWIMLFNVWGIIWRNNKQIIRGTLAGTPSANAALLARQAFLASQTNFYLSFPLLFFMAAASHFALFGR